jgi:hypothetical protein
MVARLATWDRTAASLGLDPQDSVTSEGLVTVVGVLRSAGYRSAVNYLHAALQRFVMSGGVLCPAIRAVVRGCERACKRGQGPPNRAAAVPLTGLVTLPSVWLVKDDAPRCQRDVSIVACWWMLREIELASIDAGDVCFETTPVAHATLLLKVSKMDQGAKGSRVALACVCTPPATGANPLCPHCAMKRLYTASVLAVEDGGHNSQPLVVAQAGGRTSKAGVLAMISKAGELLGVAGPVRGHSFRVSGAVYLAKAGISTDRIMALGRWTSSAVNLYLRDAPTFATLATSIEAVNCASRLDAQVAAQAPAPLDYVFSTRPGVKAGGLLHKVLLGDVSVPPVMWAATCGWRFAEAGHSARRTAFRADMAKCTKCFGPGAV